MSQVKQSIKRVTPAPLWRLGSDLYWQRRNRWRHALAKTVSPRWQQSLQALKPYRDRYAGKRCFIIGNGPSLRQTDLSLLKGEYTFGLNRIYLMFEELGFTTSFLVVINDLVIEQCADDIKQLQMPKFITWRMRSLLADDARTIFLDTDFTGQENFSGDAEKRLFEGFTVTYAALQLAFYMGFQEAILIGVDHNYQAQGRPNEAVVSQGDDPNHFSGKYFGKGFKWQLPDLEGSERAYRMARTAYEAAGRRVLDATVGGKLQVFSKVDYCSLFE
jgi:hypothetical protein